MEIKVFAVVHVEAGIVHDVRPFTEWEDAKAYRDELVQSFKPDEWIGNYNFLDYNEGSGMLHIQETLLSVPDRQEPYDESVSELRQVGETLYQQHGELIRFIREYFSRYDIQLSCLEGISFSSLNDEQLVQVLNNGSDIMLSKSNIQGILDQVGRI